MDFLSLKYILFVLIFLIAYYLLPRLNKKAGQSVWLCLLAASLCYYLLSGPRSIIFLLVTSFSVYLGASKMGGYAADYKKTVKESKLSRDEKKALKASVLHKKRIVLAAVLVLNFGILAWLKYWNALFPQSTAIFGGKLLLPLGISFYTFQAAGYLIDIYGDKYKPCASYLKFLLFVSWFPQLLQGPINRYDKMEGQLFEARSFDREKAARAAYMILFGLLKKYAVADMLSGHISQIFDTPVSDMPGSMIIFAILLYSVQQYADFSGGIDIVLGVSGLFGIDMMPNFRQPYFSISLGDFWRRWHISLGAWMRDYIFYPFALIKPMQNFGKTCTKKFGKHFGRVLPAAIANILVFLIVGIWHGAELHYVLWGLYNGLVIALSDLSAPFWNGLSVKLHLPTESKGFHLFRIIRTFIIVNIGWYFDRISDAAYSFTCLKNSLLHFEAGTFGLAFQNNFIQAEGGAFTVLGSFGIAIAGTFIIFIDSILKENGKDPAAMIGRSNFVVKGLIIYCVVMLILISFIFTTSAGGFLYANF